MSRNYQGQPGDSFTFDGQSFVADESGVLAVDDAVPHEDMLSHGFVLAFENDGEVLGAENAEGEPAARRGRKSKAQ